jgi:hypothetical protein
MCTSCVVAARAARAAATVACVQLQPRTAYSFGSYSFGSIDAIEVLALEHVEMVPDYAHHCPGTAAAACAAATAVAGR